MAGGFRSLFASWLGGGGSIPVGVATYTLTADAGPYTLTGQPTTFLRTYVLDATLGDYTLTGNATTLTYSGAVTVVTITTTTTVIQSGSDLGNICIAPATIVFETGTLVDITSTTTLIESDETGFTINTADSSMLIDVG